MLIKTPTCYWLCAGASKANSSLNAFDAALLDAGIGNVNIVKMSSILPPKIKRISPIKIPEGSLVPAAYASITSDTPGELIAAAVAVAIPEDNNLSGLIMEYSGKGSKADVESIVRRMCKEGMDIRGRAIKSIEAMSVEIKVEAGLSFAAFAAAVLWG